MNNLAHPKMAMTVVGCSGFLGQGLASGIARTNALAHISVKNVDVQEFPEGVACPPNFTTFLGSGLDPEVLDKALEGSELVWIRTSLLLGGQASVDISKLTDYLGNVEMVSAILTACAKHDCRRIIFDSSEQVFGTSADLEKQGPLTEPKACNYYGATKSISEKLLGSWQQAGEGRSLQIFRYSRVRSAATRDVIYYMVKAALSKQPIKVIGNPDRCISFVHIDDVIAANLVAIQRIPSRAVYHVSADRPVSLMHLATLIRNKVQNVTGDLVEIEVAESLPSMYFEPHIVGMSWDETQKHLGLNLPRSLNSMIDETVAYL